MKLCPVLVATAMLFTAPSATAQASPSEAEEEMATSISLIALGTTFLIGGVLSGVAGVGGGTVVVASALAGTQGYQADLTPVAITAALAIGGGAAFSGAQALIGLVTLIIGRSMFFEAAQQMRPPEPEMLERLLEQAKENERLKKALKKQLSKKKRARKKRKARRRSSEDQPDATPRRRIAQ